MTVAENYQEETGQSSGTSINIPVAWDYDKDVANLYIVQQDLTTGNLNNSTDGSFTFSIDDPGTTVSINQSSFFTGNLTEYTVSRNQPRTQDYDPTESEALDAPALEETLDDTVKTVQDLGEDFEKHGIVSQDVFEIDTAIKRANKFLSFDENGDIELVSSAPGIGDMLSSIYDPAGVSEQLVGLIAAQTLTNKSINGVTLQSAGLSTLSLRANGSYLSVTSGGDMLVSVYDAAGVSEQLVGETASQALTNKSINGVTLSDAGSSGNYLSEDGSYVALPSVTAGDYTIQIFEAGGTWNKPAGLASAKITVIAGGGGAGGASGTDRGGGGGGGGGNAVVVVDEASLGSTETVTIGAGGVGVANTAGTGGSSSSFGAHASATGGGGGLRATSLDTVYPGGAGGSGTGGDVNIDGGEGGDGYGNTGSVDLGGAGGSTLYGFGAPTNLFNGGTAGTDGNGFGAGGSGAGGVGNKGGDGTAGIVIVEEHY